MNDKKLFFAIALLVSCYGMQAMEQDSGGERSDGKEQSGWKKVTETDGTKQRTVWRLKNISNSEDEDDNSETRTNPFNNEQSKSGDKKVIYNYPLHNYDMPEILDCPRYVAVTLFNGVRNGVQHVWNALPNFRTEKEGKNKKGN